MAVKLIALDLDGTLLNSKKIITERTLRTLKLCAEKGIFIVPATGRTEEGIPEQLKKLPGVRYAVTTNGAVICDLQKKEVISRQGITWEIVLELIELLKERPVMYDAYIMGRGKSEKRFLEHLEDYNIKPEICSLIRATRDEVPDLQEYIKKERCMVDKMNIMFRNKNDKALLRTELEKESRVLVTSSMPGNLEINAAGVTKGGGLALLRAYLGLKREETLAFGDGENDLPMILEAGIGVAMENAALFLKESADKIAASNDEDGVAVMLEEVLRVDGSL